MIYDILRKALADIDNLLDYYNSQKEHVTGNEYEDWENEEPFFSISETEQVPVKDHVYIIGHSLAPTDRDILRKFIGNDWNGNFDYPTARIYYHSKNSLKNEIANLVAVIGEEETINFTYKKSYKEDARIEFRDIEELQK